MQVVLAFSSLEILTALQFSPISLNSLNSYSATSKSLQIIDTDFILKLNNKAPFSPLVLHDILSPASLDCFFFSFQAWNSCLSVPALRSLECQLVLYSGFSQAADWRRMVKMVSADAYVTYELGQLAPSQARRPIKVDRWISRGAAHRISWKKY